MSRNCYVLSIVTVIFGLSTQLIGQDPVKKKTGIDYTSKSLDQYFNGYFLTASSKEKSSNGITAGPLNVQISQDEQINLILNPADLLSENYIISFPEGSQELIKKEDLAIPYEGYIQESPGSQVRVTQYNKTLYGYIQHNGKQYFIEPANTFDNSLGEDVMIIYTEDQVKKTQKVTCASTQFHKKKTESKSNLKSSGGCQVVEMAIATDYAYRQAHGGTTGAINQTISVMNMVAGVYVTPFTDEIRFEIVEHFISNCSSCDPWTSSTDANTLLNDFTGWGPSGFTATHDIGQFWTDRNMCGGGDCSVAGLAWINAVCGTWRYHILEDFTTSSWQLRVLVSHEMGHNFGSNHDTGSGYIMAPSVSVNTTSWSSQSISAINSALTGYYCFEECVIGSCTEILNTTTSNCTPGSPSTYDLSLEIRHGGGGTSTSFDVNVNGQAFNFTWSTSPQIVTVTGLIADGTPANAVAISANDGSDSGCAGSAAYDEPSAGCSVSYQENFDNCSMPSGWSASSTNIYTWNSGDPLVQYEWKFDDATRQYANYNDGSNGSSLKTIDGTCMALMDDDIINHTLYTGDVTLNSPIYDMSGFDTIMLQFDYNFHPFEDGGKGANSSYFEVEVYDGLNWISVLFDNSSPCDWYDVWPSSCATYADLDLSNYVNAEFRVRFIYSDGNDGKWTGMIALDNVKISGSVTEATGNCEPVVEITNPNPSGVYEARDMIIAMNTIVVDNTTSFSADSTSIIGEFEITAGAEFTVMNEGCQN